MVTFRHDAAGTPAADWRPHASLLPSLTLDGVTRIVVLAAHPDDETLGAGGLTVRAHELGLDVSVLVATHGEGCHPRSPTHSPERLAARRAAELDDAVDVLSPGTRPVLLDIPDGAVAARENELVAHVVATVGDGRATLLVAPWRGDGHPDHEAVGRAAATAAVRTGARLLEYPVWFWHWGEATTAPWAAGHRLDLDDAEQVTKQAAVASHRTQVRPLSDAPGDEVLLTAAVLEHFATPYEVFWELPADDRALDELHRGDRDPWGVDRRWYELRKRALVLAMLPRPRFRRAVEIGCSTGALAADLARRCDELVAVDASPTAAALATDRLGDQAHVEVRLGHVPEDWPDGEVDLVVLSEVGYFLSPAALDELVVRVRGSLARDGVLVACHWRHDVVGWPLDGDAVHQALRASDLPPVAADYRDRDVEILVLATPDELPDPHG